MRCEEFRARLREYLDGSLEEPGFGERVEHEAECPDCRRLVCESQADFDPALDRETAESGSPGAPGLLEGVLARTTGEDCAYIEQRLAERMEEPLEKDLEDRLAVHLEGCLSCRRVRDVLDELPVWYGSLSAIRADGAFRREVMRRTLPAEPGILEVLRALWRKPEAIWEAAVACAMITVFLFGHAVPRYADLSDRAKQVVVSQADIRGMSDTVAEGVAGVVGAGGRILSRPLRVVHDGWGAFERKLIEGSAWVGRTGRDLRAGDSRALLEDFQGVLKPLGVDRDPEPRRQ
jgi:hypothetical protein